MKNNLVLIGMPGCGKTSAGKMAAAALGFECIDTDALIETKAGKPIPQIFAESGEAGFRRIEKEVVFSLAGVKNAVICTGGGVVIDPENVAVLRRTGKVCWIMRPVSELASGGIRPLSKSPQAIAEMYEKRKDLYRNAAEYTVSNTSAVPLENVVREIIGGFNEN